MTGASYHRGNSNQVVSTPDNFLEAVVLRFGQLDFDLAANKETSVAGPKYLGPGSQYCEDALSARWDKDLLDLDVVCPFDFGRTLWLNPPYSNIAPWAEKAATCWRRHGWLLFLVPSSTGARWFQEHLVPRAMVLELVGRLTFRGQSTPYPKDLVLACFGFGIVGRAAWDWRLQP